MVLRSDRLKFLRHRSQGLRVLRVAHKASKFVGICGKVVKFEGTLARRRIDQIKEPDQLPAIGRNTLVARHRM